MAARKSKPADLPLSARGLSKTPTAITLAFIALLVFLVGDIIVRHVATWSVTNVQTMDAASLAQAQHSKAHLRSYIPPASSMDGRWWIIHTEQFLRGDSLHIRATSLDNAPIGREVHWSSLPIWLLAGIAQIQSFFLGIPAADLVAPASFWFGPLTLFATLATCCLLFARPLGGLGVTFLACLLCLSPIIYQAFRPGEMDHHGLAITFSLLSALSLALSGVGSCQGKSRSSLDKTLPTLEEARRGMMLSGALGGAALWISAASFIPVLVGMALGAVVSFFLRREHVQPDLWRVWGAAGCVASLAFYLLEYFPFHMGFRLEVNHPLYALAWLGGGDLLARLQRKISGGPLLPLPKTSALAMAASLLAILAPALLILLVPGSVFWVRDRFLLLLHQKFINEFQTLPSLLSETHSLSGFVEVFTLPVFVALAASWLFLRRLVAPVWLPPFLVLLVPALVTQILAVVQIRWLLLSTSLWAGCATILLAAYLDSARARSRVFLSLVLTLAVILLLGLPVIVASGLMHLGRMGEQLPKFTIPSIIARDVAYRLVQSSPDQIPVVLAAPDTSTDLSYFAGIHTIGTLYWENMPGLKRAASFFAAGDEGAARRSIDAAGVTHILAATWDDFGRIYVDLLGQSGTSVPPTGTTFFETLLRENQPPDWLRPLYYPIPAGFNASGAALRLYAVVPTQSPSEALMHRGIYEMDAENYTEAAQRFTEALAIQPGDPLLLRLQQQARQMSSFPTQP